MLSNMQIADTHTPKLHTTADTERLHVHIKHTHLHSVELT